MWQQLKRAMPAVFGMGLVLTTVLLLIPSYPVPKAFDFYDKAQHGLMFTTLLLVGLLAYPQRLTAVAWGLVLYGGLMEVLQTTLTTTRHGDWFDWLADSVGVVVGLVVYFAGQKIIKITTNSIAK
jgi:VanZ family protein